MRAINTRTINMRTIRTIVGTDADGLFAFVEPTQAGQVYLALHPDPSNDTLRVCALSGAELLDECSSNRSVIIVPLDRIIVRTIRRIGELVEIHLEEDDE